MPKSARLIVLSCAVAAAGVFAGPARPADPAAQLEGDRIRAHVEFLASDLLEGREAGTRGYDVAARYVASWLELNGLQPAGDAGTFYQAVPLVESTVEEASVTLTAADGSSSTLAVPAEAATRPDAVHERSAVRVPIVYAGFGVTAPAFQYDDYAGLDVRGKAVLVFSNAPASFPGDERAYYGTTDVKIRNAAEHGARAVLVAPTQEDLGRFPWERMVESLREPRMTWVDAAGRPGTGDPRIEAVVIVSPVGLEKIWARAPVPLDRARADAAAGHPGPLALPLTVDVHVTTAHRKVESSNIVARLPGSDPRLAESCVLLTAHLDHTGIGRPVKGDRIYNGAYDNATGTAILLEMMRAFAAGAHPRRSLLAVFVTAEEKGLLGSDYFAHHPAVSPDRIVADLNLDMPVLMWPIADVIAWGADNSTLGRVVERAARENGLKVSPDPIPEEHIFVRSDQYSFVRQGVPAAYLMPGLTSADPAIDASRIFHEFMNTHYHQPSDDLALPMDHESAGRFLRVNQRIVDLIANDATPPAWLPGNFFGVTFGHGRPLPPSSQ